ncbi:Crp/Fnr family transcriptional regulator [Sporomusa sp. KB1]|jgi:CRP-like cAMP-binding protein|uniref:Crp/Fnr family transcriptional regulator n=1 Tax=Sporomusa sp. KB1 TaxID=943346 RepID=UPI00119EE29D|nr:Crp/Fnr family transcriptional regulator [Sporomusa sp. KB1]TWH52083.1 CRP/FNR family transcriptional regulator [Sporomusa sp. KB1]
MLTNQIQDYYSPWISKQNILWESVLQLGQQHFYKKGSIVLGNGQPVNHLYYLRNGQIKFSKLNKDGDEKIVWYIERGNVFGVAPFFDRRPITNMCNMLTTMEDCEIYTFSRSCFNGEIVSNYPELVANLMQSMAYKIFLGVNRGGDLASLPNRICKVLLYILQKESDNLVSHKKICSKGISQQELAFILGVHRVTLNNAIAQLKREGIIGHMSKRSLVINNMDRLLEYAQ